MKKVLVSMIFSCLSLATMLARENSLPLIDSEDISAWSGKVLANREIKLSGEFSFETFGKYPTETIAKEFIPVSPDKTYSLSGFMRSLSADNPASGYLGLKMYDKDKRYIGICNVATLTKQSALSAPAAIGDLQVLVKLNLEWLEIKHSAIAFNVQKDYSDLPNFDLSPQVSEFIQDGENLKVVLKSALKKDYPMGTLVRLHSPWGAPLYWIAQGWMTNEWQEFKTILKGEAEQGTSKNKFWQGTKYVKPFFWFGNWDRIPKEGARLLVDQIRFDEIQE
ncbi:MAG: hypothetical protein WCT05_07220 [Lentisphaeria bacterium]